jgi:hypothetical protein
MARASEAFCRWPSLALSIPSALLALFMLLAQCIQPGQPLALQDLAVVVTGKLNYHRGAVRKCQTRVETHELEQFDGHERELHAAVYGSVSLGGQVHVVKFANRVLDYNFKNNKSKI